VFDVIVVSPCTTFTLPENVASFFLSCISSEAASIWIGWSRFCEKPCSAFGTPVVALCADAGSCAASSNTAVIMMRATVAFVDIGPDRLVMTSLCIGCLGRPAPMRRRRRRLCGLGFHRRGARAVEIVQVHHDMALEADHV